MLTEPEERTGAARGFAFTCAAFLTLAALIGITYLPKGFVGDSITARQDTAKLIWPMAWRFYINSADREYVVAYQQTGGSFVSLTHPAAAPEYLRGLSRKSYGDLVRLTSAAQAIPPDLWRECDTPDITECANVIAEAPRAPIPDRLASHVCGPAVFAVERPSADRTARCVTRVAAVELTC
ncbi:hypothetical protein SAMN04488564_11752 [Lentzea waywayandensis]|uniref:Antimicrobial peptide system protein, SdpA family n=1 Tax=Lentzea waywayandensis TaxID=84724 RepID=A0A1I6FGU4_9PSEU|nr:hypothetical protein [Lentzea waywayandensis]SFR29128.1 hypothetical protein SAMN04488564_11752 [Lentzea waywayandensis]